VTPQAETVSFTDRIANLGPNGTADTSGISGLKLDKTVDKSLFERGLDKIMPGRIKEAAIQNSGDAKS